MSALPPHTVSFHSAFNLATILNMYTLSSKNNVAFDNTLYDHQFPNVPAQDDHTLDWRQKCDVS